LIASPASGEYTPCEINKKDEIDSSAKEKGIIPRHVSMTIDNPFA
jgi:hypothetical protein